ncbi:ASCH domain-containing protein [Arthrobacter sp. JSM 101049]|uniref:ASCH domain-containing protein n=1 Tax=Arthrobacter sp. JSM 101049 TaxID=929097 RepID=UPI0035684265
MTLPAPDLGAARHLWDNYRAARPDLVRDEAMPPVEYFGDHPALADELLGLVVSGRKRATATLSLEFTVENEPLPRIGDHWIACDGTGTARLVLRSTALRLGTIADADEDFARAEGEDDGSLESWLASHRRYWQRVAAASGFEFTGTSEIVFEHFEVVWPRPVS